MRLPHTCFISYRHRADATAQRIIEEFRDALATQIGLFIPDGKVFFDRQRLRGGDFWEPKLARELCHSACMVLLFDAYYFDPLHPYCAREYLGMVDLEQRRLKLAGNRLQDCGLIIPVVVRGEEALPVEIRARRQYVSLERMLLQPADFRKVRRLQEEVRKIAQLVYERHEVLRTLNLDLGNDCGTFQFPDEQHTSAWLRQVVLSRPDRQLPLSG
jgi:TIR domain-containing protein